MAQYYDSSHRCWGTDYEEIRREMTVYKDTFKHQVQMLMNFTDQRFQQLERTIFHCSSEMKFQMEEERAKRDEAFRQMEQQWQKSFKDESSLHRAAAGHLEERLSTSVRDMLIEAGSASTKAQQVLCEFGQLRDNLREELNVQKLEIGNASSDLSKLIDEVRKAAVTGVFGDVTSVIVTEMTENFVRAEVRRLAGRCVENSPVDDTMASEMQALASRMDHLECALENESASRQEEGRAFLSELQELMKEQGRSQTKAFQKFEDDFTSKLDTAMSEARLAKENCLEEKNCQQQINEETKALTCHYFDEAHAELAPPQNRIRAKVGFFSPSLSSTTCTPDSIFSCPPPWQDSPSEVDVTSRDQSAPSEAATAVKPLLPPGPPAASLVPVPDESQPRGSWLGPAHFDQEDIPFEGKADQTDLFGQPETPLDITGSSNAEEEDGCINIPGCMDTLGTVGHKEAQEEALSSKASMPFQPNKCPVQAACKTEDDEVSLLDLAKQVRAQKLLIQNALRKRAERQSAH